jgi:formate hydrogenlyase subunit 6/NADH:ubiquinone oxidoreductase subunit I
VAQDNVMIPIYVMGRKYEVPYGLTILKALEYAGYRITRGCGCRGGVCGACVTVYRLKNDYRLRTALACQTLAEPEMFLTQLPYTPAHKAFYFIHETRPQDLNSLYPEMMRCVACNTCTKACPAGLEVMQYVAAAIRSDLKAVVDLSMECVMCGMCAARCPAELAPFNIAIFIRRTYARHLIPASAQLKNRLQEIASGKFDREISELKTSNQTVLISRYQEYQVNKGESV